MKDLKRHTPAGLSDLTPEAHARKRVVERRIEAVFESWGYTFISSPTIEYRAVFEGKGSVPPSRMYGFPDAGGDMLALRPDMTPAAARIAATHPSLGLNEGPLRLCYIEKAFRNHERYQGKVGEFTQAGVELMGERSAEADAEVVALAAESLQAAGLTGFRVDVGQVDFLRGVLADSGLQEAQRETLTQYMIARDYTAVEAMIAAQSDVSEAAQAVLGDLTRWMGGIEMLAQAEPYATHPLSRRAIEHLRDMYAYLRDAGLSEHILFDLSMTGHLDYYTGVIFRGYVPGAGYAVVDGGRYDHLLEAFGRPAPAVGFAIRLDGVLDALTMQEPPDFGPDTLVAYAPDARATALRTAGALRRQGVRIENMLRAGDETACIAYARGKHIGGKRIGGVLYFIDADRVKLHDLAAGTETIVSTEALAAKYTGL